MTIYIKLLSRLVEPGRKRKQLTIKLLLTIIREPCHSSSLEFKVRQLPSQSWTAINSIIGDCLPKLMFVFDKVTVMRVAEVL